MKSECLQSETQHQLGSKGKKNLEAKSKINYKFNLCKSWNQALGGARFKRSAKVDRICKLMKRTTLWAVHIRWIDNLFLN